MNLYVANTSKQHFWFCYRMFGNPQAKLKMIKHGQQIKLELNEEELKSAIDQNLIYGMKKASEMSRHKGFSGLCYSTDGEINIDRMLDTFNQNDESKDEEAQQRRKDTAAAISENIGRALGDVAGRDSIPPSRLEVTVQEDSESPTIKAAVVVHADPAEKSIERHTLSRRKN